MTRIGAFGFDPLSAYQGQLMGVPTPGFGYRIGAGDVFSSLMMQAYGQNAMQYASPFMAMNPQIPGAAFGDLSRVMGQLLFFPILQQLQQQMQMQMQGQMGIGMGPSAAQGWFAGAPQGMPMADPELAGLLTNMLLTGQVPGARGGVGPNGIHDAWGSMIRDDVLMKGTHDAIREGRTTQGGRGTQPTADRVEGALGESWTPVNRTPTRAGVVPMSQLDYNGQLGNGGTTIRRAGCYMTALTMAATKITGDHSLNPAIANDRIRRGGGFSGSNLMVDRAAGALGMRVTGRTPFSQASIARLDQNLDAGRPVVAGVDYKDGRSSSVSNADHFLTLTGRNADGSYTAIDPAGGREITFRRGSDGRLHSGRYTISEMTFLDRR